MDVDALIADITVAELEHDPYPLYARMRAERPVAFVPAAERWLVTRWADCEALTRLDGALQNSAQELDDYFGVPNILSMEGPEHRGLRAGVDAVFRPRAIAQSGMPERARAIADGYVARVRARGACDATGDILEPISVRVIGDMLGFGDLDDATLTRWFHELSAGMTNFVGDPQVAARAAATRADIDADLRIRIARLTREPDGSALASMIHVGSVDGRPRTFDQLVSSLRVILLGGLQEPGHAAASSLLGLLSDPAQLAAVRADPATLLPLAVHEGLRWIAPFGFAERRARRALEIGGAAIPAGGEIGLVLSSASRDEARYAEPDRFDLGRERIAHASFGFGAHYCSGHAVSRPLEEAALGAILDGLPGVRLDPAQPPLVRGFAVRGPVRLPIVWDA